MVTVLGGEKTCFVLMPFQRDLDEVYNCIKRAARRHSLTCLRADEITRPGNTLRLISEEIDRAAVVIADLTRHNPNVFYETALAHDRKTASQVVLIAQRDQDVPWSLQTFRYQQYDNNRSGLKTLEERLDGWIKEALSESPGALFEQIIDRSERTRRIIAECESLLARHPPDLSGLTVRTFAGLSSFAIRDEEVELARRDKRVGEVAFRQLLIEERDVFFKLVNKGSTMKVLLAPPVSKTWAGKSLELRYQSMIDMLWSGDKRLPIGRVHFAIAPVHSNHMLILGDGVFFEGTKTKAGRGYQITTRWTAKALIEARVQGFDNLFLEARKYTLRTFGAEVEGMTYRKRLRAAVCKALQHRLDQFQASESQSR